MLNLQTKRGCPFRCVYCTYPQIEGQQVRPFPPAEVAGTARFLQDAGARFLFITDASFNCIPGHGLAVARAMRDAGVSVPWDAFFTPIPAPEGYYRELAAAGLTHVEFGTESLSEQMLRSYRKPFRVEDVLRSHEAALDAGLHVAHYFMLGGPGETRASLDETIRNAERLRKSVLFFFCGVRVYPATGMHEIAVSQGQVRAGQSLLKPFYYSSPALDPGDIGRIVEGRAAGRSDWVLGAGGARTERIVSAMYARGRTGPLWEKLIC
jgi:radical SAM superfamily enzyme YgiQ (UPF0313 family)